MGTAYGNQDTFITTVASLIIGQSYQGGIVAYILQPGDSGYNASIQHGLIAAPSDQSTGIKWYNGTYLITNAIGTAIGTGASNTALIISVQGSGSYAASICTALTLGGYTDWYLPSEDELNELYINRAVIGGFASVYYWSSTEANSTEAWVQYFPNGGQGYANKGPSNYVRAVRRF